ncbi:hypothetical protein SELMODRAFT_407923 [Selaginella moellendorffii]|uniref:Uncharacterized protein n=1 Tax=Selaginella moellendorffii TaxID=88036 RepID=D8R573_SELML|nr:hypothetical protein SELMODRAFT_417836 [Selaginella moellendorffii]EFJ32793.1 hypothetical protein SELMODRAFT_407923 [Selaginella moellendorffii]
MEGSHKDIGEILLTARSKLHENYKMYSNLSISSQNAQHYMVITNDGGTVQVQPKGSNDKKGQLEKYQDDEEEPVDVKGEILEQNDEYVLVVKNTGKVYVQLDDEDKQEIKGLPW